MTNLLQAAGATPNRQPKFVPLFMDRAFTGLYTQRSPLHDPSDLATARFYGGRPDALLDGLNIELTNRLTLQRRPGLTQFSTVTYPTIPNIAFSFEGIDNLHRVMIDTGSTGSLPITSVDITTGTTTTYHGTFPDGGSNAYVDTVTGVGMLFTIAGFVNAQNNGTFECTASTTTTLTLANTQGIAETLAATAISSGAVYYDKQNGTKQLLFGKAAGAGQTYFIGVAGVLYMGDGIEVKKYTPDNPNGEIWRWGIVAPTVKPGIQVVTAGNAAVKWQAATWFSTMGLLLDSNMNLQVLTSVNADGTNPDPNAVFGTSSIGNPPWNHTIGGLTTETSGVTWRTLGWLNPWTANTTYSDYGFQLVTPNIPISDTIFDVATNSVYNMTDGPNVDTSSNNRPAFTGIAQSKIPFLGGNPNTKWTCYGPGLMHLWQASHGYVTGDQISEYPLPPLPGQTNYIHACINSGTSAVSYTSPPWETLTGNVTVDGQLAWTCMGQAARQDSHSYTAWVTPQSTSFSAIVDVNNNIQVCIQGGMSDISDPGAAWGTAYGSQTTDGSVVWSCAGPSSTWATGIYCLPGGGFSPHTSTNAYGGVNIEDSNNNQQWVIATGFSGSPTHPTWATAQGATTFDPSPSGPLNWVNNGPTPSNSFTWFKSLEYVYAYKARVPDDPYNTTAPPLWSNPLGVYKGSGTGAVSSASPLSVIPTGDASAVVFLTLTGSLDPQVDTIEVYRTTDGGATFEFLTDIPNPAPSGGNPGVVVLQDYMPQLPNGSLPGLNPLILAPVDGVNNPPADGYLPMVFNFQRIWGAAPPVDQIQNNTSVFFSGGPDTLVGNPNEAFDPSDEFPFLSTVIRLVKSTKGLGVFLNDSIELIAGGPTTASFFSVTLSPGIGLRNFNALDVYAGEIFFFASDGRFVVASPELQLAEFGFPIADRLINFNPDTVHVAAFQVGLDACVFVADGATGWYRVNPRQIPGGFSGPEPIWSPFAAITSGCKFVQAIEVSSGVKKLLVGPNAASGTIRERNLSVFTDAGTEYDAFFVMGSLMLANPGQTALLKFLEMDFSGVSYRPTVGFLLNEISGSFTNFTQIPTFDPPQIYGKTITPSSYSPNRYYFTGEQALARCRHMQIRVDFGATAVGDEMYNLTIFGRFVMEP